MAYKTLRGVGSNHRPSAYEADELPLLYPAILILLVISCLSDSILVEIPKGPPLVAVDEKSPLYPRTAFKHKRPGSTLGNP